MTRPIVVPVIGKAVRAEGDPAPGGRPRVNESERGETMTTEESTRYRAMVERCNFLVCDRPDIQYAAKEGVTLGVEAMQGRLRQPVCDSSRTRFFGSVSNVDACPDTANRVQKGPSGVLVSNEINKNHSKVCREWLQYEDKRPRIRTRGMVRYTTVDTPIMEKGQTCKIYLGGYDATHRIAYEFYGDHWHGNPKQMAKTQGQVRRKNGP